VYHPAKDNLFTAYLGSGTQLNGKQIKVKDNKSDIEKIELRMSKLWKNNGQEERITKLLTPYKVCQYNHSKSMALSYCELASGQVDGLISITKDCFPEFAGSLIVQEAGGMFTNLDGNNNLNLTDRIFVGGKNKEIHQKLLQLTREVSKLN